MASATKDARLELRITRRHKTLLERAAALTGSSTSQFVTAHALAAASQILEQERVLHLSQRDFERFVRALEQEPEEPTPAMREAVEALDHGQVVGGRHAWSSSD